MKKLSWQYALGEICLIFLGITLAVAFQNWNEQRKQNKLEIAVLKQLKVALSNDLRDVTSNIQTHQRAKNSCQELFTALDGEESIDRVKFTGQIIRATDYTFLVSDVSTYEYLKSVGLHIIQDDSLRNQITNLYDVVYEGIYGVEDNITPIKEDLMEDAKKYFTAGKDFFFANDKINEAKKDEMLRFDLKNIEFSHQVMISKYQQNVQPELEKLLQIVDNILTSKT